MSSVRFANRHRWLAGVALGGVWLLGAVPPVWADSAQAVTAGRFVLAFIGGLALNLTTCVYPIIPITISFFAGQAQQRVGRTAVLAACYVLGLAITYSMLGLIASLTGGMLGAVLQQPWVPVLIAVVMVALGLSLCGLFEVRIPAVLASRLGVARTGAVGALIMGLTVGIVAAPCIGPFVLGMLLYVGQLGRPVVGFWLFFALALDRVVSWFNTLVAAALAIVWVNPTQLCDPGFQLSFGAVLSLLVFTGRWQAAMASRCAWLAPAWLRRYLCLSVGATAAVWVGLSPVLAWYFHLVCPVSMLANVLIAPLMSARPPTVRRLLASSAC